jgi:hypothetical protein
MTSLIARRFVPAVLVAALAAACGGSTAAPTPTPTSTTPATVTVTDSFDGSLAQSGANIHTFSAQAGAVTVTLTAVGPLSTLGLGMDVGTWDGTNCTTVLTNNNSKQGTALVGTATSAVNLCIRVYDVGNIADGATVTYTVTAQHQALSS